jgi:hypothetical protein
MYMMSIINGKGGLLDRNGMLLTEGSSFSLGMKVERKLFNFSTEK